MDFMASLVRRASLVGSPPVPERVCSSAASKRCTSIMYPYIETHKEQQCIEAVSQAVALQTCRDSEAS